MNLQTETLQLTIETLGFEGKSIAHHNGIVVFVEGGVSGDTILANITKKKKKYWEAKILEILSPSPQRTTPQCSHFGICGGCKWQHVEYTTQLHYKHQHVIDALERIGGLQNINILPIIPATQQYFYRNKIEFSFGDQRWLTEEEIHNDIKIENKNFAVGFHIPQRYDKIVDIQKCYLQSELSNFILQTIKIFALENSLPAYSSKTETGSFRNLVIREGKNTGDVMVNLVTFDDNQEIMQNLTKILTKKFPEITTIINNINTKKAQIAVGEYEKVYYGEGIIHEKLGDCIFAISANSFFQTNTHQAEKLYTLVKEFGEFKKNNVVYDLYCGTGSIGIFIANSVQYVVGIDIVESSIVNARMNAKLNCLENCEFIHGDLKDLLTKDTEWQQRYAKPDVIILDPPRSGMHPKAVEKIGIMKIPNIVYVSCNPATLARDIQMFNSFGYSLEKIQPVDMFPHTYHIESVAKLVLE